MNHNSVAVKLGMLISYDYAYIYHALPYVYPYADEITIAIDKDRKTWLGAPFAFDEQLLAWLKAYDREGKLKIYEDHFYQPELTAMQCEVRERTLLSAFMGEGGWHVQLDADEYFPQFGAFATYLKERADLLDNAGNDPVDIYLFWLTLYRQTPGGFVYIKNSPESFPVATNKPVYTHGRQTGSRPHYVNHLVFHQSWAREEAEIGTKIANWGHSADFDVRAYYRFWQEVNEHNFRGVKHFHPLYPKTWKRLAFLPAKDVPEFIERYLARYKPRLSWLSFRKFKKEERIIEKRGKRK